MIQTDMKRQEEKQERQGLKRDWKRKRKGKRREVPCFLLCCTYFLDISSLKTLNFEDQILKCYRLKPKPSQINTRTLMYQKKGKKKQKKNQNENLEIGIKE